MPIVRDVIQSFCSLICGKKKQFVSQKMAFREAEISWEVVVVVVVVLLRT